jgi:ankyrin repeat protein
MYIFLNQQFHSLPTLKKFYRENKNVDLNKLDKYGNTLLHLTIKAEEYNIAHYLIDKGADVNIANKKLKTPLILAMEILIKYSYSNYNEGVVHNLINELLLYGANPDKVGKHKQTPIIRAIISRDVNLVKLLLSHGANIEYTYKNYTVLDIASRVAEEESYRGGRIYDLIKKRDETVSI